MGLVNLPILNRTGSSINWNLNLISKKLEINYFMFFFLLKHFFNFFFLDFFFFLKKTSEKNFIKQFFQFNIILGRIFLLKISNWYICYLNYFVLEQKFIKQKKKNKKLNVIFIKWQKKYKFNYKYKI